MFRFAYVSKSSLVYVRYLVGWDKNEAVISYASADGLSTRHLW